MTRVTIDVPVSDVAAEVAFCRAALGAVLLTPEGSPVAELGVGTSVVLRVCDEATHVPHAFDARNYQKGRSVRMNLRVENVAEWIARAIAAGGTAVGHSALDSPTGEPVYAEVVDPCGHAWSYSREHGEP